MLLLGKPKKLMIYVEELGLGHYFPTSFFLESNKIPAVDTICTRKAIHYKKNNIY